MNQASYALFIMERYVNKNGSFIRLVELRKCTSMVTLIFSAGIKSNGWRGIADSLQRILVCPSSEEKKVNHKEVMRNYQQYSSGRRVVSRLSYADIVKNYELNKEDLTRGKQVADTMNVRGVIEWKRVVIQKYAKDKAPEDSYYGTSSFGDVASSKGAIIEDT
ncbi:hypothetical protein LguiA_036708 [Lonicera macranthoides]